MHILIAEDNSTNAKVLASILTKMGHTFELAKNGREALSKTHDSGPFDLILMDLQMPEMDGLDASRAIIAEIQPCPPIIACTANSFQSDRIAAAEAGMIDFIAKPVTERSISNILVDIETQALQPTAELGHDWDHFDMVMSEKDEELMEIFNDFCDMAPQSLHDIEKSVKAKDFSSVAEKAHQLRGTFSTFGIQFMSRKLLDIELSALANSLTIESDWSEQMIHEFNRAETSMRQRLESL